MVIGRKFWPLEGGVDYRPSSNPPTKFIASTNGTNVISNVSATDIAAMSAITETNLAVVGAGFAANNLITAIGVDSITATDTVAGTVPGANFIYYDRTRPCAGQDQAISAVLCMNSGALEFYDTSGTLVVFAAGVLVPGAVYYFQVGEVVTATLGDYLGYAPY
jgi:hypothetical protein